MPDEKNNSNVIIGNVLEKKMDEKSIRTGFESVFDISTIEQERQKILKRAIEEKPEENENKKKRIDQERTRVKKEMFFEYYPKSYGVIMDICEKIGINPKTYYQWMKDDEAFAEKVRNLEIERNDSVEDQLFKLIRSVDGPSIRFFLNKRNPKYKDKVVNEVYDGTVTLEDLIDNYDPKNRQPRNDREPAENPQQEGAPGAILFDKGTAVLLGKENSTQHNTESAPKGDK